ncbi:hypothetical protein J6590_019918 [Homalodisca vitripennis]|nr:hypothetical protein J6590_019918 [Homalodisca vitripennis]
MPQTTNRVDTLRTPSPTIVILHSRVIDARFTPYLDICDYCEVPADPTHLFLLFQCGFNRKAQVCQKFDGTRISSYATAIASSLESANRRTADGGVAGLPRTVLPDYRGRCCRTTEDGVAGLPRTPDYRGRCSRITEDGVGSRTTEDGVAGLEDVCRTTEDVCRTTEDGVAGLPRTVLPDYRGRCNRTTEDGVAGLPRTL